MVREIRRPRTIAEAAREGARPGAAFLGGGTWLNSRRDAAPSILVSLELLGLDRISARGGAFSIGAAATFQSILDASPPAPPAVREALALTASRTLRNMATVGGELGLRPRDSALIPVLIALGARVRCAGRKRPIGVHELVSSPASWLILEVELPDAALPCAVASVSRTSHSSRSIVVAVSARPGAFTIGDVTVVVSDCLGQTRRLAEAEKGMEGRPLLPRELIQALVSDSFWPQPDMHASGAYKRYVAGVLAADLMHRLAGKGGAQ